MSLPNCLRRLLGSLEEGINPEAYQAFVDYLAVNGQPANDIAAKRISNPPAVKRSNQAEPGAPDPTESRPGRKPRAKKGEGK